ncbi:hypothetical protein EON68_00245 [archaeon]|nr:MAG: hypothetical protein EON68_00245 [archaeon]
MITEHARSHALTRRCAHPKAYLFFATLGLKKRLSAFLAAADGAAVPPPTAPPPAAPLPPAFTGTASAGELSMARKSALFMARLPLTHTPTRALHADSQPQPECAPPRGSTCVRCSARAGVRTCTPCRTYARTRRG